MSDTVTTGSAPSPSTLTSSMAGPPITPDETCRFPSWTGAAAACWSAIASTAAMRAADIIGGGLHARYLTYKP
ncbi:MAG: hypothetical protein MPL62_15135, partial [Alphaproteobacteria bacterium]|nr:hypothetical protein [Alphaproteobacteria bacterium]